MLCYFLLYNEVNSYMYTYIPSLLELPPNPHSHLPRLSQSTELSSPPYKVGFPLAVSFTHGSAHTSVPIS